MFPHLVTYHIHRRLPLPPNDTLAYQYMLAGNGVFIRTETPFFAALLPIARCTVRGLASLQPQFQLKVPRMPERLLDTILADAGRARRTDGGLDEVLYQFHHHGRTVQVRKPPQQATTTSVIAAGNDDPAVICELHSHGNLPAFFSRTDDIDEQAARVYAVIGKLDSEPEIQLRVGVYGYWHPLPVMAVFTGPGRFKELYNQENQR